MTEEFNKSIQAHDLLVVQYLNERITFDLLATLEDGFSHLATIETQDSKSSETGTSLQGGVNLLGVTLGGRRNDSSEGSRRDMVKEELVHTCQGRGNEGPPGRRQIVPPGALLSINVRANC